MSETFGVFAGTPVTTDLVLARWLRQFAPSGVVHTGPDAGEALQVTADGTAQIRVRAGMALAGGWWYRTDEDVVVGVTPNGSGSPRRDLVVVRADAAEETCSIAILTGTPGSGTAPTPTRDTGGLWEVPLAELVVAGGSSVVTAGDVTLLREFTGPSGAVRTTSTRRHTGLGIGGLQYETDTGNLILEHFPGQFRTIHDPTYPTSWAPIPLASAMTNETGEGPPPQYRLLAPGQVQLRGSVKRVNNAGIGDGQILARMPVGVRPALFTRHAVATRVSSGYSVARLTVASVGTTAHLPGQIFASFQATAAPLFVYFDGVLFDT